MDKTVILTLKQIKYIGKSIGNDIRIEVEALNNVIALEKKIQRGSTMDLETELGQVVTDKKSLSISIAVRIIEQDIIFNDVGSSQKSLKINLGTNDPRSLVIEIPVAESRGYMTGKTAIFEVTIEAQVFQGMIRYVDETNDGWLVGLDERGKERISLPAYLKISLESVDSNREYVTALEGILRGKRYSIKKEDDVSHFSSNNPHSEAVAMIYSIKSRILKVLGKTYQTVEYPDTKWKKGIYDVEIPDHPHLLGRNYPAIRYATSWFRIGHSGNRYIHPGKRSLGCITLIEHDRWDQLYSTLIKARKGDGMSIGTLTIID